MRLGASILLLVLALSLAAQTVFAQEAPPADASTSLMGDTITLTPNDAASNEGSLKKTDYMRVSGRFGYTLPDGRFVPAARVAIDAWRSINGRSWAPCSTSRSATLAGGAFYTDQDGYFDQTLAIPECLTCTARDIFLSFRMKNEFTLLGRDCSFVESSLTPRWFETAIVNGVNPGDHIDFGTQQPATLEGNAIVHAFASQTRLLQWLDGLGASFNRVVSWWDSPPSTSRMITPEEQGCDPASCDYRIEVGTDDWFNDYAIARLTARCWALNNLTKPSLLYCNGICDGAGCSYCLWCTEEEAVAYWEGALAWMAVSALKIVDSSRIYRTIQIDALDGCGVGPQNPLGTPGFFAAALRDIADPDYDNHPEYPGVRDLLSESDQHVMDVIRLDQPTTPMEFFADFKNRWPVTCAALWETAANCGYDIDVIGPGVVQGGVTSTSHLANVPSPNAIVDVEWGTPNDDCSGIGGYSVSATQDVPVLPDAIADLGPVNSWRTDVLASGTWWINVRAVDASGRWSGVYASFGPVIIENPTPANLTHVARTGWSDPVVPRPAADAGSTNVPAPTSLPGNSAGTYWNSSISNVGYQSTGTGSGTWIFADGSGFYNPLNPVDHADAVPVLDALESYQSLNLGPIQVKGGRHTFGAIADFVGEIAEDNELDNGWAKSWVWTPLQVSLGGSVYRLAPPDRIGGWEYDPVSGYYNCDGLRFTQSPDSGTDAGYWNALTLVPADDEVDYDARLHLASTGADNGFRAYSGYSSRPAGCTDAVFVNYNQNSNANWDVGIVQTTNPPAGASYEARHVRSTYFNYGTQTVVTMPAHQPMLLLEFYPPAGWTGLQAQTTNGETPVHMMWLNSSFATGGMGDSSAETTTDENGLARLDVNIASSGYNCLVLYRDSKDGLMDQSIDLIIGIEATPPDLIPVVATGWDRELIPRPAPNAFIGSVTEPDSLIGGLLGTWLNVASLNMSPVALGGAVTHQIFVDGNLLYEDPVNSGYPAGGVDLSINMGPVEVQGGLHTLHVALDGPNAVPEISETNNFAAGQWAWQGQYLAYGPILGLPQPADRNGGHAYLTASEIWDNEDGYQTPAFAPGSGDGMWAAIGAMPGDASDVSLKIHAPSSDPAVAFRTPLATSTQPGRELDFVVLDFAEVAGGRYDLGIPDVSGSAGYQLDVETSIYLDTSVVTSHDDELGPNALLDVYELPLTGGTLWARVVNLSGGTDLGVALFSAGVGAQGRGDAMTPSLSHYGGPGEDDTIQVEIQAAGHYGLVVYKNRGEDAATPATYRLEFALPTSTPDLPTVHATRIVSVVPNPFNPRTTVRYELEHADQVNLRVFNVRGVPIRTLVSAHEDAGTHEVSWDGIDDGGHAVSSGVYFAVLEAAGVKTTHKMALLE